MKLSTTIFEIAIVGLAAGVFIVTVVLLFDPQLTTLVNLWRYGHTLLLAILIVLFVCARAMECDWRQTLAYAMAAFVLIGSLVGGLGTIVTILGMIIGSSIELIANAGTIAVIGLAMLFSVWMTKKYMGITFMPQLVSLVTFYPAHKR